MGHPAFAHVAHRPWALPTGRWVWRQTWHDLLFLHWPVPAATLRALVPPPLDIDEFGGEGWVGVIPFWMSGVTRRGWPGVPGASAFPELNVRTYVSWADRPGVWFFSLDAGNPLAVLAARAVYHLPYVNATMRARRSGSRVEYRSDRSSGMGFHATYGPTGPVFQARPGTLEHWLTERYCLYAQSGFGGLYRAEIHHAP